MYINLLIKKQNQEFSSWLLLKQDYPKLFLGNFDIPDTSPPSFGREEFRSSIEKEKRMGKLMLRPGKVESNKGEYL